jgi:hypothetical protein
MRESALAPSAQPCRFDSSARPGSSAPIAQYLRPINFPLRSSRIFVLIRASARFQRRSPNRRRCPQACARFQGFGCDGPKRLTPTRCYGPLVRWRDRRHDGPHHQSRSVAVFDGMDGRLVHAEVGPYYLTQQRGRRRDLGAHRRPAYPGCGEHPAV